MNHTSEEDLVLHYYGEGEAGSTIQEHLESCALCRSRYQALEQFLGNLNAPPVPPRPAQYGQEVWRRLAPVLTPATRPAFRLSELLRMAVLPRWAVAVFTAALILFGFYLGRNWPHPQPGVEAKWRASIEATLRAELRRELDEKLSALLAQQSPSQALAEFAKACARNRAEDRRDLLALRKDLETLVVEADNRLQLTSAQILRLAALSPSAGPNAPSQNTH